MTKGKSERLERRLDVWIPLALYGALLAYKLLVVIWLRSEPQVSDEFTYIKMARTLFTEGRYNSVQYPLLYPLYLLPACFFGENAYLVMKILGAISSSFVPVCTYLIARLYLKPDKSAVCAAFSAVIPFQYVTTMTIMSENLYFPLFLLAIFLVLRERHSRIAADLGLGALLGALFMTRHITLVAIPVFALAWLMRELGEKRSAASILGRGILVTAALCLAYAPWVVMCKSYGHGFREIFGFKIASKTNPEQLTLDRLLMTAGFYLCYFSLILAPVLGLLFQSIRAVRVKPKALFCDYNRLWVVVCGLAAAFFVAVTRHSWRASYNYPEFEKIKGRYLIYFPVLFVLLGAVVLFREKPRFRKTWFQLLTVYLLPVGLVLLGYLVDIEGLFYPVGGTFIGSIESTDGQKIKLVGSAFVPVTAAFVLLYQGIQDFAPKKWKACLPAVFGLGLLLVEVWGMAPYLSYLQRRNNHQNQTNNRYAAELRQTILDLGLPEGTQIYAESMPEFTYVLRSLAFYGVDQVTMTQMPEKITNEEYYVITDDRERYTDRAEEAAVFHWEDAEYYLLKVRD